MNLSIKTRGGGGYTSPAPIPTLFMKPAPKQLLYDPYVCKIVHINREIMTKNVMVSNYSALNLGSLTKTVNMRKAKALEPAAT